MICIHGYTLTSGTDAITDCQMTFTVSFKTTGLRDNPQQFQCCHIFYVRCWYRLCGTERSGLGSNICVMNSSACVKHDIFLSMAIRYVLKSSNDKTSWSFVRRIRLWYFARKLHNLSLRIKQNCIATSSSLSLWQPSQKFSCKDWDTFPSLSLICPVL